MPKPVAEVGEGNGDASGNGVYCFIRDLIVEGRDARFVDKNGRYVINWSRALKSYHDYKSKRNPQYKSKNISRRKASNGLRAALLNFYKKEGAKEYKDCKKVNEKDEVVERQFQMPPRVFESLFGSDAQLSDDSSEHETSSIGSEADEKPLATPNSSDTGFDEAMDISDDLFNANEDLSSHSALGGLSAGDPQCSNVKTEEEQVDPSDITTPCQMFDISEEELDLVLGEICSNSDTNDIDLLGVVRDICPSSGSVKGGMQFYISLTEELSEDDKSGIAHFDGIGDVYLERLNCYTLAGTIPASQQPGPVPVTVNTQDGRLLGMTYFMYVDEIQEVLKQVVKDQALQSLFFTMWSQEHGFFGSDGNLDPFTLQGQGSSVQGTHAQALKGLQLLVYTAAQTNAQQFIQMIFSTSAGRLVFNAYKDRPQLPEDVARANGHDDLAQYLHDVNARLSKENSIDAQPSSIDWFELIEAVNKIQEQSSVVEDETDLEIGQSNDDDNESDYFADAETSSCGSFELEIGWSDSEDGEGACSKGGGSDKEPDVKSASSMNVMPCKAYMCAEEGEVKEVCDTGCFGQQIGVATQKRENTSEREQDPRACLDQEKCMQLKSPFTKDEQPIEEPDKRLTPSMEGTSSEQPTVLKTHLDSELDQKADGKNDKNLGTTEVGKSSLISQLSKKVAEKWQNCREEEASTVPNQEKTTKPKGHKERTQWWPFGTTLWGSFFLLIFVLIIVLCFVAGIKLREGQLLHWAVRNEHIRISQALLKFVSDVDAPNFRGETPLHVAAKNECKDLAELLMKLGSNVNSKDYQQQTPLHVVAWSGCQGMAKVLIQSASDVNAEQRLELTPFLLAGLAEHKEIGEVLMIIIMQHGSIIIIRDNLGRTPLHDLAAMAQFFIQHGSDVKAGIEKFHLIALHGAAIFGHKQIVEPLVHHGSDVNAGNKFRDTPLHSAVNNFRINMAEALIQNGTDVNARDIFGQTSLHLAARRGDQEIRRFLIQQGSELKAQDNSQQTALHLAAQNGHRNVGEVLIWYGSDVNVRNKFGLTPLHLAVLGGHKQIIEVFLHNASDVNARDGLQQIAALSKTSLRYRSNTNAGDIFGQTSLHLAVRNGGKNVTEVLREVSYGVRAIFGDTPLHLDAWSGHQELTEFLLRHGSGGQAIDDHLPKYDINVRNNGRQSPLHLASENDYKHMCDVLTHNGSDVNTKDDFGKTPLRFVTINRHESLADILGKQHCRLLKTSDLLRQTRYKFDPRDAPVVWTNPFLEYLGSGRSLEDILEAEVYHTLKNNETNFPPTSREPIHQENQSCLASVNLSIGLGDAHDLSSSRDHKLKLNKPLITQCLNISVGGGDGITGIINPVLVIKYQGSRIIICSCVLHSAKFATKWRPKDRDSNEAKDSHSFGFVDICIKNGTGMSKTVLIRIEWPPKEIDYEGHHFVNAAVLLILILLVTFKYALPDMGNDSKKSKSSKAPVTAVARSKPVDKAKYVLILYKPWSERTGEIMNYLCDALNQVGCMAIPSKTGAVDVSEHDDEYVRSRTSQWLMSANNVVLLCIAANQAEQLPREAFIDDSGKLPSKMFPVVFGTETPSQWPECYSLGLADPENVERPNDFETEGLDTLVAAIRGTVE